MKNIHVLYITNDGSNVTQNIKNDHFVCSCLDIQEMREDNVVLKEINGQYDLIMVDLCDFDYIQRLIDSVHKTPVIIFSNSYEETTALNFLKIGVQDYIVKASNLTGDTLKRIILFAIERAKLLENEKKCGYDDDTIGKINDKIVLWNSIQGKLSEEISRSMQSINKTLKELR